MVFSAFLVSNMGRFPELTPVRSQTIEPRFATLEASDSNSGFDDFFNVSQSCKGKSEVVEMLLTLEDFFLLLSSSGHL